MSGVLEKEAIGTQTRTEGSVETREKAATSQPRREASGNPPRQQPGLGLPQDCEKWISVKLLACGTYFFSRGMLVPSPGIEPGPRQ